MSNELRKRRGDDDAEIEEINTPGTTSVYAKGKCDELFMRGGADFATTDIEDIIRTSLLTSPSNAPPQKSISNAQKEIKDQLEKDPYNMKLIKDFGQRYFAECQWKLCANVLMRGFKRVSELEDPDDRFMFLMMLCESSFRTQTFKQAQAVLLDIQEPEGEPERTAYLLLACQVHSYVSDGQKALAAFSKLIEGKGFEAAIKLWAASAVALRKADVFEVTKNTMSGKGRSGPNYHMDQERLKTVDAWVKMSIDSSDLNSGESIWELIGKGKTPKKYVHAGWAVLIFMFIFMLYRLEQQSLRKHNLM